MSICDWFKKKKQSDYSINENYMRLWNTVKIKESKRSTVTWYVNKLLEGKDRYKEVEAVLEVPWQIVGCIHAMEASFKFDCHLHNGDSLEAKTVRVPAGRPTRGNPPFTWLESAIDALKYDKAHLVDYTSIPETLNFLEGYNGYGYRSRGINSPYLWSFTNHYTRGKYVRDGIYNPLAVSKQCGICAMLIKLEQKGLGIW